jgi:hypothetical protein
MACSRWSALGIDSCFSPQKERGGRCRGSHEESTSHHVLALEYRIVDRADAWDGATSVLERDADQSGRMDRIRIAEWYIRRNTMACFYQLTLSGKSREPTIMCDNELGGSILMLQDLHFAS